jgi:uncharacterized repeat protein (TIGR03803 family)
MKTRMTLLCAAALLALGAFSPAQAQSPIFDALYDFSATSGSDSNNLDGAFPESPLVLSGATLFGAAIDGGTAGNGTIFSINTNRSDFTNLYSFSAGSTNDLGYYTNSDGATPFAGLVLSSNTLYGTTASGGTWGSGTVFRINTDRSGFTNLYNFTATSGSPLYANGDGANPVAGLVLVDNTLYGTAQNGGNAGNGTVFQINTDGSNFMVVHTFSAGADNASDIYTNSDGAIPVAALILSGNVLFGLAEYGGNGGSGSVFSVNIVNFDFTNLYSFSKTTYEPILGLYTNSDGAYPVSGLVLSSNTLYGTAQKGGSAGTGTVFGFDTNRLVFTNLFNFSEPIYDTTQGDYTNTDGFYPVAPLTLSGSTLYGTAQDGGSADLGTVFSLHTNGSNFTTWYNFSLGQKNASNVYTNSGGALPVAPLILSGNMLYGAAALGGSQGDGTVFALSLPAPPSPAIARSSSNQVVISWPISALTYALQTSTSLASGSWSNITNGITTNGTNNVFTITASGPAAYFRLQQQ